MGFCGTVLGGWLCDVVPMKLLMSSCVVVSLVSLFALPHVAVHWGLDALLVDFTLLGLSGAALVCSSTTALCWAFPGKQAGPIFSGCAGAFGITSALLPAALWPWPVHGNVDAEYGFAAVCALPTLALLLLTELPVKPDRKNLISDANCTDTNDRCVWPLATAACCAQMLLQGANSALLVWLVSFGQLQLHLGSDAKWLISVLQGAVTLGALAAMRYQQGFELLNLACVQLFLVVVGCALWLVSAGSEFHGAHTFAAVAWYGFVGGPTLSYSSALFNQYTTPSGKQMSLINLGSNCGAGLAPFLAGLLMERFGAIALVCTVLTCNVLVFGGMLALRLYISRFHRHLHKVAIAHKGFGEPASGDLAETLLLSGQEA